MSSRSAPFDALGLPVRYAIDDKELERAWLTRSRAVHPDRFAGKPDAERRKAAEQTAALNDAYRAIKDPFDRAVWLVTRADARVDVAKLDQPLLMALMEARERADESAEEKARVVAESAARFQALAGSLAALLADLDDGAALERAGRALAEMKTLARLVDDLGGARLISTLDAR